MTNSKVELDSLGSDLTELILSRLPIPSILRASSVCKSWNSIIHSHPFETRISNSRRSPWFFLSIQKQNSFCKTNHQVFAFDPESDYWIKLPETILLSEHWFTVSSGFSFAVSPDKFSFKPVLNGEWCQTSPLTYSRCHPLIGVYEEPECSAKTRFIVVGGIKALGSLQGCLDVEIYDPDQDFWELCSPAPEIFRHEMSGFSSMCSAIFKRKFYIYSNNTKLISSFDLSKRSWSGVRTLKPPGARFSYLIPCRDHLVLAGWCNGNDFYDPGFFFWRIDEKGLEFSEIGTMPQDAIFGFFGKDQEMERLRFVGSGNLVYIFSDEPHQYSGVCVCEISNSGKWRWRRVPDLPGPGNGFYYTNKSAFVPMCHF